MFQDKIYQANKGVAMGSPISRTVMEIFIQHFENIYVKHILDDKNIRYYTRYVDNILIIYDNNKTNPESITQQIKYTRTCDLTPHEANNRINFLDLQIIKNTLKLEIDIYQKPTTTDTTINFTSNQPMEHKTAAYRYYFSGMHSLPQTPNRKQVEWTTIQTTAQNNGFPTTLIK